MVLPMLITEVVDPGWVTHAQFYSGMALTQSLPGPLFNFSSYLGAIVGGLTGAACAWLALFGHGVLLVMAVAPFWTSMRGSPTVKSCLTGVNAAAVGLIVGAFVLLWHEAVKTGSDATAAIVAGSVAAGGHRVLGAYSAPIAILSGAGCGAGLHYLDLGTATW